MFVYMFAWHRYGEIMLILGASKNDEPEQML